jgi:hypothetical protein
MAPFESAPDPLGPRYSWSQVRTLEHPAWATDKDGRIVFFDGIYAWARDEDGRSVSVENPPQDGWWHRPGCSCQACVAARGG